MFLEGPAMSFDLSKDFISSYNNSKYQHFSNGRSANLAACMTKPGVWICGKHSFMYLKQKDILNKYGISLLGIDEEVLYSLKNLKTIIRDKKIEGVCFEVPCSYLNERNPFDFYNISKDFSFRQITDYLAKKNILTYIDGARLLIYSLLEKTYIDNIDFISIGLDKSLSNFSFLGSYMYINNNKYIPIIKKNRKMIGGYIRKYNFDITKLKEAISKKKKVISSNHLELKNVTQLLRSIGCNVDFSTNCIRIEIKSTQTPVLITKLNEAKIRFTHNENTFQFYFDLSLDINEFNNILHHFKEVFLCLNYF